ncbi:MAG TPA: succinate--CoA ligase subunit beta, partial [Tenuifilaceae bacterium]|nr:succinate--CoA ligase subunit beta [Tenuifilaceae bacterium]
MNLHEYQSKALLKKSGVNVPLGSVAFTPDEAVKVAESVIEATGTDVIAVKAQIHAGGRGKGGGVKIAKSTE